MDLPFLHFPTSLQVEKPRPKGKKMRMDHPFILGVCQHLTLYSVFTLFVHLSVTINFLKLVSCFNSFVYVPFKHARPQNYYFEIKLLFQNRTPISKQEPLI